MDRVVLHLFCVNELALLVRGTKKTCVVALALLARVDVWLSSASVVGDEEQRVHSPSLKDRNIDYAFLANLLIKF